MCVWVLKVRYHPVHAQKDVDNVEPETPSVGWPHKESSPKQNDAGQLCEPMDPEESKRIRKKWVNCFGQLNLDWCKLVTGFLAHLCTCWRAVGSEEGFSLKIKLLIPRMYSSRYRGQSISRTSNWKVRRSSLERIELRCLTLSSMNRHSWRVKYSKHWLALSNLFCIFNILKIKRENEIWTSFRRYATHLQRSQNKIHTLAFCRQGGWERLRNTPAMCEEQWLSPCWLANCYDSSHLDTK